MGHLRRLKPGRTLLWSMLVFVICLAGHPNSGWSDVSVGIFIVDGVRYQTIGQAYADCTSPSGNYHYSRCQIWDYNLINGEAMNSLPWDPNGGSSYTPFDLHLGPGTLKICDASPCSSSSLTQFTFVIPRLSHVTGTGRSSSTPGGTVIQAGAQFGKDNNARTLVQIGDADGSTSFGSLLSAVTVDCNYVAGCTGIENTGGQEQSGLVHVNVVNYATRGIYIHGSGAQNSHYTDVEVNGCLSQVSCLSGTTPVIGAATVPLEIDNVPALRPIEGITVNPVNTTAVTITAASYSSGSTTYTYSGTAPFSNGQYVTITGILATGRGSGNFNGTYAVTMLNTGAKTFVVPMSNPGTFSTSPSAAAAIVPTNDVLVCSGTSGCADTSGNPTTVTFIGAHLENGGFGIHAVGPATTLNLVGGSCPNIGSTSGSPNLGVFSDVAVCAWLEAGIEGAHVENFYPGPASVYSLEDDNFSYNATEKYIELYDIGATLTSTNANRARHCSEPSCTDQVSSLVVNGPINGGASAGVATVLAPASGTPTLTLPTTTGNLAQNFVGDGIVLSNTPANASTGGALTASLASAAQTTVLGNPTGSAAAPVYTTTPVLGGNTEVSKWGGRHREYYH